MRPKKIVRQEKRVRVNLTSAEFGLLDALVRKAGSTHSSFLRELLVSHSSQASGTRVELCVDQILARLSKLERVQRYLMMNTAIARGHATGTLDAFDPAASEKIRHRIVEARDQQRKIFFELYPEQKEGVE
jgi:hypothetical protein